MSTHTQYTIFNINKKNTLNNLKSAAMGFFSKNEFETDVVNETSVFEPLKFNCNLKDVELTSMRRYYVASTSVRRH